MSALIFEKNGEIGIIRFNRPDNMNAIGLLGDGAVFEDICNEINNDKTLRVVIITGQGRAFSAGGDIKSMRDKTGIFSGSCLLYTSRCV